jgi:hypothetical protein
MSGAAAQARLVCPRCGVAYEPEERFCADCGLPLVLDAPDLEVSDRHGRARKIKPQLAEGPLVSVAYARNQPEAEFIQGLLLEEGVPSVLRRSAGFDVPDFLAGGPRDVLVAASGVDTAREVLLAAEIISDDSPGHGRTPPIRLLAGLLLALALGTLLVWLLYLAAR